MGNDSLNLARLVFGHLAGIECRRGLARGWLLWLRALVGTLLAAALLFLIWAWWLAARYDSTFAPGIELRIFLSAVSLVLLTITAVQAPGGAGRQPGGRARARNSPASLDHHRQPARNRRGPLARQALAGRHDHPRGFADPGVPGPAGRTGHRASCSRCRCFLAAVGFGAGGLAVGASVVSRRGRDAQLTVYILMIVLMMSPLLGWLGLPRAGRRCSRMVQPLFQHESPGLVR